jgi:hypothetical protein
LLLVLTPHYADEDIAFTNYDLDFLAESVYWSVVPNTRLVIDTNPIVFGPNGGTWLLGGLIQDEQVGGHGGRRAAGRESSYKLQVWDGKNDE